MLYVYTKYQKVYSFYLAYILNYNTILSAQLKSLHRSTELQNILLVDGRISLLGGLI